MLCADIQASLDKLTDAFGGSSQGSYNGAAVFASILISQLPLKSFGCSVIIYLPFNGFLEAINKVNICLHSTLMDIGKGRSFPSLRIRQTSRL